MGFRRGATWRFALGVGLRASMIALLAYSAAWAVGRSYWATALILSGLIAAVIFDLVRSVRAADRVLSQFVDCVLAEGFERPAAAPGLTLLGESLQRALDRLAAVRADRQRRIDFLEALNDTVAAALLVLDDHGQVVMANRSARAKLGIEPGALAAQPRLGEAALQILALRAGSRAVLTLPDHSTVLAQSAQFSGPGGERRQLVALQAVAGELDAVELKAWHDLVRVLAHEMMNSLTPICALSQTMLDRGAGSDPETVQALEVISRRSAGLMAFIDSYRRLGDLPAPVRQPVILGQAMADLDRLLLPMAAEAGVAYQGSGDLKGLTVRADPDLLQQALINLVKNAVEAVRGHADARVRIDCELAENQLAISVADNGPGLEHADAEAVFVPFYTTKSGGSGIGLALSRQIAIAHGGRLDYRPGAKGGAVFTLSLPVG
jgi:nitrogen fixation/metabolism regulation signal transduction histidine kinase